MLIDGDSYEEVLRSENGAVALPAKENYTYTFTYNGAGFDGTGVTKDMYVETHCYPTNGIRKTDSPCVLSYDCIYCGKAMQESITNHYYRSAVISASPTQIGHTICTCATCGDFYYDNYNLYSGAKGGQDGNMWWQFYQGNLAISCLGDTPDYDSWSSTPWKSYSLQIRKLYISNGTTSIGERMFSRLTALENVFIPDTIEKISDSAFFDCNSLQSFNCHANLKTIGSYAFASCGLSSLTLNEGLTTLGSWAFSNCVNLEEISIPSSVKEVDYAPFDGCSGLKKVIFEEGVTYAFDLINNTGSTYLDEVVFPSTLTEFSLLGYNRTKKFTVHPDNERYCSIDGVLYSNSV